MNELLETPMFGILLSLVAFELGTLIGKKTKLAIMNPLLIANVLIIAFLLLTGIKLETYDIGGRYISFFLGPATVVLALPLYRQISSLKTNWFPILCGIALGSLACMAFVVLAAKLFGFSQELIVSLIPKSITTPMGIEVARQLGGNSSIAVAGIVATGISGAIIGPALCRFFRVKDPVAKGVAAGTASHAIGTSRAMEFGEVQGAMASLSIGIAGVFTSVAAPFIIRLFA